MNTIRKPFVIGLLVVFVLGLVGMAFAATPVFAQTDNPPTTPSPLSPAGPGVAGPQAAVRLEKLYQTELKTVERQAAVLEKGNQLVIKAEKFIADLQAKGVDTSKIEAALKTFQGLLADASASHTKAAELLKTHAGFDPEGKVTDRVQAARTVKEAGQALKETRRTIAEGRRDLNQFLREWRKDHKPTQPGN
jgi:hypothetical protein